MVRRPSTKVSLVIGFAVFGALAASACTPVTTFQGYQVVDQRPADVKIGEDTKATVRTKFGSPTLVSTFEPNIWYYMSQTNDTYGFYRPRVRARNIVALTFAEGTEQVAEVNTFTEKDGQIIAYNDRETPTLGRQLNVLEQILGTLGAGRVLPREEDDPGTRPGEY